MARRVNVLQKCGANSCPNTINIPSNSSQNSKTTTTIIESTSSKACSSSRPPRLRHLPNSLTSFSFFVTSVCLIFSSFALADPAQQRIAESPTNTSARIGETVILKCRVENQKGKLQWVKNGLGLGTDRNTLAYDHMSMVGKLGEGEYHLQIRNVTVNDDDVYECQLSPTDSEASRRSSVAKLTILVEPQPPKLDYEDTPNTKHSLRVSEGKPVRVTCHMAGARPAATLGWALTEDREAQRIVGHIVNGTDSNEHHRHLTRVRGHQRVLAGHEIAERMEVSNDETLSTTISDLTFTPSRSDNGKWLACLAWHATFGAESRSATVPLDVYYPPKVRIVVDEDQSEVLEGGRLFVRCVADARPAEDVTFHWTWDGEPKRLLVTDKQNAMLNNLKVGDNAAQMSCTASNEIGTGNATLRLDIPYAPRFLSTNQTKLADIGDSAIFHCDVVSNPTPEVRWFRREGTDPIAIGNNFTISSVDEWADGEYRCTATVPGFPPKSLTHRLYLKGPPKVHLSETMAIDGNGVLTLNCEVTSRLQPIQVQWFFNGRRINFDQPHNSRYASREVRTDYGLEAHLSIQRFGESDYGLYNCTAKNDYGTDSDQREVHDRNIWESLRKYAVEMSPGLRLGILGAIVSVLAISTLLCCLRCDCCLCRSSKKKSINFNEPKGDIHVKCEALDNYESPLHGSQSQEYRSSQQHNPDFDLSANASGAFGVIAYGGPAVSYSPQQLIGNEHYYNGSTTTENSPPSATFMGTSTAGNATTNGYYHSYEPSYGSFGIPAANNHPPEMYAGGDPEVVYVGGHQPRLLQQHNVSYDGAGYNHYPGHSPYGGMLEPVTEVDTPLDTDTPLLDRGTGGFGEEALVLSQQQARCISRTSTHV